MIDLYLSRLGKCPIWVEEDRQAAHGFVMLQGVTERGRYRTEIADETWLNAMLNMGLLEYSTQKRIEKDPFYAPHPGREHEVTQKYWRVLST